MFWRTMDTLLLFQEVDEESNIFSLTFVMAFKKYHSNGYLEGSMFVENGMKLTERARKGGLQIFSMKLRKEVIWEVYKENF